MRNYTITSVWGIPIRINVSLIVFLPILAWIIGSGTQIDTYALLVSTFAPAAIDIAALKAGTTPWLIGTAAAVGLFVSVALHELGHAWAARRYGIGTKTITLWLLGGIADLESMPREWNREFWIALAGPVTSVLVAVACYIVVQVLPAATSVATFVFGWLVVTNVMLAVFNLIPAFPMDGGRIFRAVLARSRPYEAATRSAARLGTGFAIVFAIIGVLNFAPMLILLSLFVYGAASSESKTVVLQGLLADTTIGDVMSRPLDDDPIDADATVQEFTGRMLRERRTVFPVADGGKVSGIVTLDRLRNVNPDEHDTTAIRSIMVADLPRVDPTQSAFDGFVELSKHRSEIALVESDGDVVGLVTLDDFASILQLRREGVGPAPRVAF